MNTIFHTPPAPELPRGTTARIPGPRITRDTRGWRYEFEVLLEVPGAEPLELGGAWFRSDHPISPLTGDSNTAFVASLFPLMMIGVPVVVEGSVSPRLVRDLQLLQATFADWFSGLQPVTVECENPSSSSVSPADGSSRRGEGVLFSLGVDSWFSLINHLETIDHLVFIDGFDLTEEQSFARRDMREAIRHAAHDAGKPVITVETNLRNWLDRWIDWGVSHSSVLGAVTTLLEGNLERLWLPSSAESWTTWDDGSNPFTDALFATERMRRIHDGGDRQRVGKLVRLLEQPLAMNHLRVCWSGTRGKMNCGECPKCVRTMVALHLLGGLERARLFDTDLDPEKIDRLAPSLVVRIEWLELRDHLRILGVEDDPVARAMESKLRNHRAEEILDPDEGDLVALRGDDLRDLARADREGFAEDFRQHAPSVVSTVLGPAVEKAPRETFRALWKSDHRWLQRELRKIQR